MATFVLVHGSGYGGWCWKLVAPLLRAAGDDVYTPTLTGLGERAHLAMPEVGLETHVLDVVNVLRYEDLRAVILVGHSLGGMAITGAANDAADRIAQLVYLDAVVPVDGESRMSLHTPQDAADKEERVRSRGGGWRKPGSRDFAPDWDAPFGTREWERTRKVPQPFKVLQDPVRLHHPTALALPRTFVYCTRKKAGDDPFADGGRLATVRRSGTYSSWRYRELDSGHMCMFEIPRQVADLLIDVAENPESAPLLSTVCAARGKITA